MRRLPSAAMVLGCAAGLLAQGNDPERAAAELARAQREYQQNRSEVERLIDMRLRHDLGLPGEDDAGHFRPSAPVTTETMERARQELRDQDATNATLVERFNKLKGDLDQLRAETAAQASARRDEPEFVVIPQPGTAARPRPAPGAAGNESGATQAVASEAPLTTPDAATVVTNLDPIRGTIHGSEDHQRVAQALFKAGQALMDRALLAREQGQPAAADELDARAKERLTRALDELAPLLTAKEPPFPALFYQGRCRELLFRLAEQHEGLSLSKSTKEYQRREQEAREPFLAISLRDVTKKGQRGEIELLGPWGMAAQTAMEHFRWMNLHGGYRPTTPIESITWPGEHDQ